MKNPTIDTRTNEATGWGGRASCLMKVRPEGASPIAAANYTRLAKVDAVIRDGGSAFVRILGHWWDPAALAFVWPTSIAVVQVGRSWVMLGRVGEDLAMLLVEVTPSLSAGT